MGAGFPVVEQFTQATSTPVIGSASDTSNHILGPFIPNLNTPIWLTLVGSGASGVATVLRSIDGGVTKLGLTAGGAPWATFVFSNVTGVVVNEAIQTEFNINGMYYISITLTAGSITAKIYQ